MNLGLEQPLTSLVKARFHAAKAAQSLAFSDTELTIIHSRSGLPFQLRYCPSLAKKPTPKNDQKKDKPKGPKPDPFDNPPEDLFIADLPKHNPSHFLVLNKFPIIPEHFILATKTNKQQTHMLEADDLAVTHACLKAWEEGSGKQRLYGFFNSGDHSGASQAHRHLQFVPIEEMQRDAPKGAWGPLIDLINNDSKVGTQKRDGLELKSYPGIPFQHFVTSLPPTPSESQLHSMYKTLYSAAEAAVREYIISAPSSELALHPSEGGESPISYNLAMTTSAMAIVPRRNDGYTLHDDGGEIIGQIAFNGTLLAGTLMVKGQAEWDWLRSDVEGKDQRLDKVLEVIGIPVTDS